MEVRDKVVVVTGGGSGIGRALCRRFAAEGARAIAVADLNESRAREVAAEIGGLAFKYGRRRRRGFATSRGTGHNDTGTDRPVLFQRGDHFERRT